MAFGYDNGEPTQRAGHIPVAAQQTPHPTCRGRQEPDNNHNRLRTGGPSHDRRTQLRTGCLHHSTGPASTGQQQKRLNDKQADHKAANATMHQPNRCRNNDPTKNRPHASQQTPNQPGMQGMERLPTGWRHHAAPRPPTTIPTDTTEHAILQLENQPTNGRQRTTSELPPPGRAQARHSQEA